MRAASLNKASLARVADFVEDFLVSSNARSVLLVDRAGQPVAECGEMRGFNVADFAALAVADFAASESIATYLSAPFSSVFHQGANRSLYLAGVADELVLIVLFDQRVNAGMMRIKVKAAVEGLASLCLELIEAIESNGDQDGLDINWGIDDLDFDWIADLEGILEK